MSPPWMPLYIADYRADTAHLGAAEHGAYLLLIMHYWQTSGLPDDDRQLARIACMTPSEWKRTKPLVARFFTSEWQHKRIDKELAHASEVVAKRRAAAQQRYAKPDANAPANAEQKQAGCTSFTRTLQPQPPTEPVASATGGRGAKRASPPASRIDLEWQLGESELAEARKVGLSDDDARREWDKFRDHFLAAPSERGRKVDWLATWRTWARKAAEGFGRPRQNGPLRNGHANGGKLGAFQRAAGRFSDEDDLPEYRAGLRGH